MVAPDTAAAVDALHARLGELDAERLDARIEQHQTALRATVAGGEIVRAPDDAERVALRDQQLPLGERLGRQQPGVARRSTSGDTGREVSCRSSSGVLSCREKV